MAASNPSHLLISRNPRFPAHPQLAPASTSRHDPSTLTWPLVYQHHRRARSTPSLAGETRGASRSPSIGDSGSLTSDGHGDASEQRTEEKRGRASGGRRSQRRARYPDVTVHATFRRDAELRGRVKVVVGRHEFWCHRDVLWFASPFFQALLQGSWSETAPVHSPTDTDLPHDSRTLAWFDSPELPHRRMQGGPPDIAEPVKGSDETSSVTESDVQSKHASVYHDAADEHELAGMSHELRETAVPLDVADARASESRSRAQGEGAENAETSSTTLAAGSAAERASPSSERTPPGGLPALLTPHSSVPLPPAVSTRNARPRGSAQRLSTSSSSVRSVTRQLEQTWLRAQPERQEGDIEAVVELKEEDPGAFQDFLFWAYPHLECKVTWTNVEPLLALASKLIVPSLQKMCEHFLMTHASGRPIVALKLAELHDNAELYREASRFVLDQAEWDPDELDMLSDMTQLKLSRRRTWFLERLLKLGTIDVKKEYTCRPGCPDTARCQAQLDDKWRQAHTAVSRFGPPQPSVAFRCLRQLETFPTNPSLVMAHPLCQSAAKAWVTSLFDRMFQPKMTFGAHTPGTEKYWLYMTID